MGKRDEKRARLDEAIKHNGATFAARCEALEVLENAAEAFGAESEGVRAAAVEFARAHLVFTASIRAYADAWDDAHPRRGES